MRIKLSEINAGDWVDLRDKTGNQASGTVLLDATRGRLVIQAFGLVVPFASIDDHGRTAAYPGVVVFSHTESLFRAAS